MTLKLINISQLSFFCDAVTDVLAPPHQLKPSSFLKLLEIHNSRQCNGKALSKGRGCRSQISDDNFKQMMHLVGNLSFDLDEHTLNDNLIQIAKLALCKGRHQDQAPQLVEQWMRAIRREEQEWKRREEEEEHKEQDRREAEVPEREADEEEGYQEHLGRVRRQPPSGEPIPRQETHQQDTDLADILQEESSREYRCSEEGPQQEKHPERNSLEKRPSQETMHEKESETAEEWYRDGNHEANQEEVVGVDILPQDSDSCEVNSEEPQSQHAKRHVLDIPAIPSPPNQEHNTPDLCHRRNSEVGVSWGAGTSDQQGLCPERPQMNSGLSRSKSISSSSTPMPTAVAENITAGSGKKTQLEEHVDLEKSVNLEELSGNDISKHTEEADIRAQYSPDHDTSQALPERPTRSTHASPNKPHPLSRSNTDETLKFNTAPSSPVVEPLTPSSADTSMQNTPLSFSASVLTTGMTRLATSTFSNGRRCSTSDNSCVVTPAPLSRPLPIRANKGHRPVDGENNGHHYDRNCDQLGRFSFSSVYSLISESGMSHEAAEAISLVSPPDTLQMLDKAGVRLIEHCKEMVRDAAEDEVPTLKLDLETGWDIMDAIDRSWS